MPQRVGSLTEGEPVNHALRKLSVAACLVWAWASPAWAHLGGEIVRPVFTVPAADIIVVDGPVNIAWNDPDEDPTGRLEFYITSDNIPPSPVLSATYFSEAQLVGEIPISDTDDVISWDPATTPPGVYTVFSLSVDPPLCNTATSAAATLVVPDPSVAPALPLAGLWTTPGHTWTGTIAGKTNLRLAALSQSPPTVTLELGRMVPTMEGLPDDPCGVVGTFKSMETLAVEVAGEVDAAAGTDRWTFRYFWDPAGLLPGGYVVRATFANSDGQSHTLFTPVELPISAVTGGPDAAPDQGPSDDVTGPDASTADLGGSPDRDAIGEVAVPDSEASPPDSPGCAISVAHPAPGPGLAMTLICLLFGLGLSIRRRAQN